MSIFSSKEPGEVFTPRSHEVNSLMYVNRPEHERALMRAIKTGYNVVVFGDSGCGKSWLYKKIFADEKIYYQVVDFSASVNADDVDIQLLEIISDYEAWAEVEKTKTGDAEFKPGRIGLGHKEEVTYKSLDASPFLQLLSSVRKAAGKKRAFLVFENLEYILDKPDVIRKIQLMLLSLDDPNHGKFQVRICLVGVPSDIKEILSNGNRFQTISNRVYEVPEVDRLPKKQTDLLILRGLEQQLDFEIRSKTFCLSKIAFVTYRIPQYVQDVCLHIALIAEDSFGVIEPETIDAAMIEWMYSNSRQGLEFVRNWIMSDKSKNFTKARIIYAISRLEKHFFSTEDINDELERQFRKTLSGKRVQTLATLRKLSEGENRILKCDAERRLFRVATPQLRSCLRICLEKNPVSEKVSVRI